MGAGRRGLPLWPLGLGLPGAVTQLISSDHSAGANISTVAPGHLVGASFRLEATASDFAVYFPTYLANGYFSIASTLHGTAPALSLMTGLMDRTPGDVSRPAALPGLAETDYFDGTAWLNESAVTPDGFLDYRQTLDMFDGTLTTRYRWNSPGRRTGLEATTLVSQAAPHLAATRLVLTPEFDGTIRLRFPLQVWPAPVQRLALARESWQELKHTLAQSAATRPLPPGAVRPPAPSEILTWFDLQQALAAEGRELVLPNAAAPTRATVWYPGEVSVQAAEGTLDDRILSLQGTAIGGAHISVATAIELPEGLVFHGRIERGVKGSTLEIEAEVRAGRSYAFAKYISVSRAGWGDVPGEDAARAKAARATGFAGLLAQHQEAWCRLWQSDVIVEGDPELQRLIHADMFYLLQNSTVDSAWSMGACGLSPGYFGHVFWDADTWNFPVMLLLHPERAKSLVMFRSRTLGQAKERARRQGFRGAMFPWESDPELGDEQTPHYAGVNSRREIHLNGAIAASQWQYYLATGDLGWLRQHGFPVIRATADFWISRVVFNSAQDRYEIRNVTSVDEKYTNVDNEAFTNAVAQKNLVTAMAAARLLGEPPDPRWTEVAAKLYIPFSVTERRHLIFDEAVPHDRFSWLAGSLSLLTYPALDLAMPDEVRRNDYAYAVEENAKHSPEMHQLMGQIFAIHAAELGDAEAALHWLRDGQEDFFKPPFLLRSETPSNNVTHLLLNSAGFLQCFLNGFTGLRVADEGLVAKYAPVLPGDFKQITLKSAAFRGERFDFTVARDATGQVQLTKQPAAVVPVRPPNH